MSNADKKPLVGQRSVVELFIPELSDKDLGRYVKKVVFKGFINNGYAIRIQIKNANFAILDSLFETNNSNNTRLLDHIRSNTVAVKFRLKHDPGVNGYPRDATRFVTGYITTIYPHGSGEIDHVEIIAIDPINYYFRIGDAYGGAFKGNVSSVIKQLFEKYTPRDVAVSIPNTTDSDYNVWCMMRRTPRDMLSHLLYLASSFDRSRTPWVIGIENHIVKIGPITSFEPKSLAYYRKMDENGYGDIISWESILNPSLGHYEMGLVTAGVSATLGQVYDQTNQKNKAIISDNNTENKFVPKQPSTGVLRSTIRPSSTFLAGKFGRSFVESPPEYFNGGEIDQPYLEYFDAYARTEYTRHINKLFTIDVKISGHGIWDTTIGLGAVNAYLDWRNNFGEANKHYFLSGNWLVYGFEHTWLESNWTTIVKMSKIDQNAAGRRVGLNS